MSASSRLGYLLTSHEASTISSNVQTVKPVNPLRFLDGQFDYTPKIIENKPIQNNRWGIINTSKGEVANDGDHNYDYDYNESVWILANALGSRVTTDIGATGHAYQHVLSVGCSLPMLSFEQAAGNLCDWDADKSQEVQVMRVGGAMIDSFKLNAQQENVKMNATAKAHVTFLTAAAAGDATAKNATPATITSGVWADGQVTYTLTAHGLTVGKMILIDSSTPDIDGVYEVVAVPTSSTFKINLASDPGTITTAGDFTILCSIKVDEVEGLVATDDVVVHNADGVNEAAEIAGVGVVNKVIAFTDDLTELSEFTVANDTKVELAPQTPSYATNSQLADFDHVSVKMNSTVTLAESTEEIDVKDWEFEFKNNLETFYGSKRKTPGTIAPKAAEATFKFNRIFESLEERDAYVKQLSRGVVIDIRSNTVIDPTDTNNNVYSLKIELYNVKVTTCQLPIGNDDILAYQVECKATYSASDGKAIKITAVNAKTEAHYES